MAPSAGPLADTSRNPFSAVLVVVVLISSYLLLVFLVPVILSAVVSYRSLPTARGCPHCLKPTTPLRSRRWQLLSVPLPASRLQPRWCTHCGWEGLVRLPRRTVPVPPREESAAPDTRSLDVRALRVDGRTWRVQLQCWTDTQRCYGRLVFIEPSGRPWTDAVQSLAGATQIEVLGQALSIPDRTLASRLRQLLIAD